MRAIRRYFALRSYVKRLSVDLKRRFGLKPFYTIDHVTKAIDRGGYSKDFVAYAHATFCSHEDFDAYYGPLKLKCSYDGLRNGIARRYLRGRTDFDAEMVIRSLVWNTPAGGPFQTDECDLGEEMLNSRSDEN